MICKNIRQQFTITSTHKPESRGQKHRQNPLNGCSFGSFGSSSGLKGLCLLIKNGKRQLQHRGNGMV